MDIYSTIHFANRTALFNNGNFVGSSLSSPFGNLTEVFDSIGNRVGSSFEFGDQIVDTDSIGNTIGFHRLNPVTGIEEHYDAMHNMIGYSSDSLTGVDNHTFGEIPTHDFGRDFHDLDTNSIFDHLDVDHFSSFFNDI
ncbi:hypothetical protein N5094_10860 [Shewanella putrefaciens]|uniref:hypothetical protein n=1 Tax=Shewanella TaxID=22 RepID=UPI0020051C79|nr:MULTISPECIES: hypothetical protein [Shewanella]MCK7633015.1 hypothetical protein [Shewanella sp. JNE17]MCK7648386.1 hypothetical protein [Shewanella sp. JNE8]MCK7656480.1 hypothetical protein [Shewanella sp. JNE4-2]UPO32971.1 hypothetical protein MZ182_09170 [Shewanella sp. JNE2]UXK06937.1 hypothetical protein N5094_10860 [Shewanella putrefaciens]